MRCFYHITLYTKPIAGKAALKPRLLQRSRYQRINTKPIAGKAALKLTTNCADGELTVY